MHIRILKIGGDRFRVEGRGHDQKTQIGSQCPPDIKRHRKSKIALERTLMEFVKYHKPDIRQFRIAEKTLGEKPFRNYLKTCAGRHLPFKTDRVPYSAAYILTQLRGDV